MSEQKAVTEMFDDISPRYDFLNHLLSFRIDKIWRRKTSQLVAKRHPTAILDVATGTADLAIRMAHDIPTAAIIGVDLSEKMLDIGRKKISRKQLDQRITLMTADAAHLPFDDGSFDAVTVAFGVRNFENLEAGLQEMVRVAKNDGLIAILEFSHPSNTFVRWPYRIYSKHLLPLIGRAVSRHQTAYTYLPSSIEAFPESGTFIQTLKALGIADVQAKAFLSGIATRYHGFVQKKPTVSQ
ncbi:MAG: bifunctional demethylmenaquinone methyltransferase/2-methoxy-6-polyprenyl-1,4-benzoquinol methylase UbiE [Bacteroidales bacterium]|nr:bifunctional demethylmenaquinone methyltransferase/2-methoxy-6-polyprenyl-1,4-benzoquinol methylase UbiE [Bacteroidales bacterium]